MSDRPWFLNFDTIEALGLDNDDFLKKPSRLFQALGQGLLFHPSANYFVTLVLHEKIYNLNR